MASTIRRTEPGNPLGKLLIDRRAHRLLDVDFHREEMLSTREVAAWLGVSDQFLEIGRTRGYGPKFKRITDKMIRYRCGDIIDWLESRTHACTSEYGKGAE
jgi:predicted DNA-binding transcriptional regulator AlpA